MILNFIYNDNVIFNKLTDITLNLKESIHEYLRKYILGRQIKNN